MDIPIIDESQRARPRIVYAFRRHDPLNTEPDLSGRPRPEEDTLATAEPKLVNPATHLARCFLGLASLPRYPLDRLSRYEARLWRQAGAILFVLDNSRRRKSHDRQRSFCPQWER